MVVAEIGNHLLLVDFEVANFDASEVEPEVGRGQLLAVEVDLDEAGVPVALGHGEVHFVAEV